jgi:hypothetical protein
MLKKLLQTWLIGILPTLLIVLVQNVTGKYEDQSGAAWAWFFVNTLPSIALIAYVFFNKETFISDKKYNVLFWLSIFYALILLFSLLSQPFSERTALETLHQSEYWLIPMQLLFLLGFNFAVFGKKESNNEMYESIESTEENEDYDSNDLRSLLAHNQLPKVFEMLKTQAVPENGQMLLLLENRYNNLQQSKTKRMITNENAIIEHNQIVFALQDLIK